jgi:hypothetical protein
MIITFCFLILYNTVQPYCTPSLSQSQACCLISQFFSLFSGLCLVVNSYIRKDLNQTGQTDTTSRDSAVFEALILGVNLIICVLPILLFVKSEEFSEIWIVFSTKFKSIITSHNSQNPNSSECKSKDLQKTLLSNAADDDFRHSDMTQSNSVTALLGWNDSSIQEIYLSQDSQPVEFMVTCSDDSAWSVALPFTQAAEP